MSPGLLKGISLGVQVNTLQAMGNQHIHAQRSRRGRAIRLDTKHWRAHHLARYRWSRNHWAVDGGFSVFLVQRVYDSRGVSTSIASLDTKPPVFSMRVQSRVDRPPLTFET